MDTEARGAVVVARNDHDHAPRGGAVEAHEHLHQQILGADGRQRDIKDVARHHYGVGLLGGGDVAELRAEGAVLLLAAVVVESLS